MKITKRQLRRIIREEKRRVRLTRIIRETCGIDTQIHMDGNVEPPLPVGTDVPVPEDYDAVRDFLEQNSELVDLALSTLMRHVGASCERSTAQGIIDHLQDVLHAVPDSYPHTDEEFSFTGDVGQLPGDEAFGIGYNAGKQGL